MCEQLKSKLCRGTFFSETEIETILQPRWHGARFIYYLEVTAIACFHRIDALHEVRDNCRDPAWRCRMRQCFVLVWSLLVRKYAKIFLVNNLPSNATWKRICKLVKSCIMLSIPQPIISSTYFINMRFSLLEFRRENAKSLVFSRNLISRNPSLQANTQSIPYVIRDSLLMEHIFCVDDKIWFRL
mgnify:FL=1